MAVDRAALERALAKILELLEHSPEPERRMEVVFFISRIVLRAGNGSGGADVPNLQEASPQEVIGILNALIINKRVQLDFVTQPTASSQAFLDAVVQHQTVLDYLDLVRLRGVSKGWKLSVNEHLNHLSDASFIYYWVKKTMARGARIGCLENWITAAPLHQHLWDKIISQDGKQALVLLDEQSGKCGIFNPLSSPGVFVLPPLPGWPVPRVRPYSVTGAMLAGECILVCYGESFSTLFWDKEVRVWDKSWRQMPAKMLSELVHEDSEDRLASFVLSRQGDGYDMVIANEETLLVTVTSLGPSMTREQSLFVVAPDFDHDVSPLWQTGLVFVSGSPASRTLKLIELHSTGVFCLWELQALSVWVKLQEFAPLPPEGYSLLSKLSYSSRKKWRISAMERLGQCFIFVEDHGMFFRYELASNTWHILYLPGNFTGEALLITPH